MRELRVHPTRTSCCTAYRLVRRDSSGVHTPHDTRIPRRRHAQLKLPPQKYHLLLMQLHNIYCVRSVQITRYSLGDESNDVRLNAECSSRAWKQIRKALYGYSPRDTSGDACLNSACFSTKLSQPPESVTGRRGMPFGCSPDHRLARHRQLDTNPTTTCEALVASAVRRVDALHLKEVKRGVQRERDGESSSFG